MTTLVEPVSDPAPIPPEALLDDDVPRTFRRFGRAEAGELAAAGLGSFALAWLLVHRLSPIEGIFGQLAIWYAAFVVMYLMIVREAHGRLVARDRVSTVVVATAGLLTVLPLVFVAAYVLVEGWQAISNANFFTDSMAEAGGDDGLDKGGAFHAVLGTLLQVGIALLICVPLALATAVYLNEVRGPFARPVRFFVNAMSGIPSIVAGLFIFSALVLTSGQYSGFAASLALSILMLPTVTRTAEEVLRLVPGGLRESALALGAPEWKMVRGVVLPTARSGMITAVILGMARVTGEAAPVLLTAFGSSSTNTNPFEGNQESLPLMVYSLIRQPNDNQVARAWGAALVLLVLVLVLFSLARVIGAHRPGRRRRIHRPGRRSVP